MVSEQPIDNPNDANDAIDEFSYVSPEDGRLKRTVIRAVEKMTGQPKLKRMYLHNQAYPRTGETFWEAAIRYLQLRIIYNQEGLANIPETGPLVVVANHPFGVLDGIVISYLIGQKRNDYKILTNSVLFRAPELRPYLLPIDFAETREALKTNLATRATSRQILSDGGTIIIFPGGTVSTVEKPLQRRAVDPPWKPFAAQLIAKSEANVLPVFFDGQNSRLFQISSHLSQTLRLSLLFNEVSRRIGTDVFMNIGAPIPYDALKGITDRQEMVDHLRRATYDLGRHSVRPKRSRVH